MEGTIINWRLPENRKVLNSSFLDCEDEEEDEILIKYPSKRRKLKYSNETPSTSIYSEEQESESKSFFLQSEYCILKKSCYRTTKNAITVKRLLRFTDKRQYISALRRMLSKTINRKL